MSLSDSGHWALKNISFTGFLSSRERWKWGGTRGKGKGVKQKCAVRLGTALPNPRCRGSAPGALQGGSKCSKLQPQPCAAVPRRCLQFLREIPLRFLAKASEQLERKLQQALLRLFGKHFTSLCCADWTLLQCKYEPLDSSLGVKAAEAYIRAAGDTELGARRACPAEGKVRSPGLILGPVPRSVDAACSCFLTGRRNLLFSLKRVTNLFSYINTLLSLSE